MNKPNAEQFRFRSLGKTIVIIDWANVYGWFSDPKSKNYLGWKIDLQKLFIYLSDYKEIFDKRFYFGVETGKSWSEELQARIQLIGFNLQSKEVKWVPVSLEKSHFKKIIKELFDVLDGIKTTNSEIATKLYELRQKIEIRLAEREPDFNYELIEEMDMELKKLNTSIGELQKQMAVPVMRRKCDFDVEIARDVFNLSNNFEHLILFSGDGDYAALVEDLTVNKNKKVIVIFAPGHVGKEYEKLSKQLQEKRLNYRLFLCSADRLKDDIYEENNIPKDFSSGRDDFMVAEDNPKSQ
ncbi:MAG: hypothetical protein UV53_C0019G0007 [Candidatus Azambacteria bacterium GW2011_GWE1_42_9]|nr:MAG: hypothetical protein UU33_C0001G0515 [Candidatus Azambacteria bacterium GW2011_GWF1_41_10]KKS49548.1 MAG: hypothetical protein UV14_C0001G0294 [Candidatus Azambacteria bacterium GW2011_GWF2_42_22]KKS69427.1 MAG: hypothetical protein UV39_C0011G0011 [Candidatus Azambacteria bacterium GW2011_GWA2_42_62]KKS74361.1 MAG: hypothetical protein UV45_C0006G0009 [Candidatus Azambacteria bacterium GW2011_GWB1_42_72]KKS78940.1 MAG: hypothetical protein UV53_C0019G0007 [Candidatus Azambacteria bacte